MNRKAVIFIIILLLTASGCHRHYLQSDPVDLSPTSTIMPTQSIDAGSPQPAATPKPQDSAEIELSTAYIDDAVIAIDLPNGIVQQSTLDIGQIYKASGYASPTQQSNFYTVEVYRFFAAEDPMANMAVLLIYDEAMETFALGHDIEYRNILSNLTFADGTGHISQIIYNNMEKYTATLYVGGVYYKIILYAEGDYSSEDLAMKILTSLQLNAANASAKTQKFSLHMDGSTYCSPNQEGASILCPQNWLPAESMHFSLYNSIMSMMTSDKTATVTVRYYSKASLPDVKSYNDFANYMLADLIVRDLIDENKAGSIQTFTEENRRSFVMPPTENMNIRYYLEYTDGYYCIEMMYKGNDANVVAQLLDIGDSFVGVGDEVRH